MLVLALVLFPRLCTQRTRPGRNETIGTARFDSERSGSVRSTTPWSRGPLTSPSASSSISRENYALLDWRFSKHFSIGGGINSLNLEVSFDDEVLASYR